MPQFRYTNQCRSSRRTRRLRWLTLLLSAVPCMATGCSNSSAGQEETTLPPPLPVLSKQQPVSSAQQDLTETMSAGGFADPNQGA